MSHSRQELLNGGIGVFTGLIVQAVVTVDARHRPAQPFSAPDTNEMQQPSNSH